MEGKIQINLNLDCDLAAHFDELAEEWGVKRPAALARLVEPAYKRMLVRKQVKRDYPLTVADGGKQEQGAG